MKLYQWITSEYFQINRFWFLCCLLDLCHTKSGRKLFTKMKGYVWDGLRKSMQSCVESWTASWWGALGEGPPLGISDWAASLVLRCVAAPHTHMPYHAHTHCKPQPVPLHPSDRWVSLDLTDWRDAVEQGWGWEREADPSITLAGSSKAGVEEGIPGEMELWLFCFPPTGFEWSSPAETLRATNSPTACLTDTWFKA